MQEDNTHFWVVTGAASGIGAAVTRSVAKAGGKVLALDVNDGAGRTLADETGAIYRHCDVTDLDDWLGVTEFLAASQTEFGWPTRIHLNAGIQIAPPNAPLEEYAFESLTVERYRRMMGVNVDGVVFGLHALLPLLNAGAAIVVTASLAGITPYTVDPLYAMSKHAVVGLVRSLAPTLLERDIRINALCPGGIDTGIIPDDQRTAEALFMTPGNVAEEVINLMAETETGKTWAKVSENKPIFIVRAPGDKSK